MHVDIVCNGTLVRRIAFSHPDGNGAVESGYEALGAGIGTVRLPLVGDDGSGIYRIDFHVRGSVVPAALGIGPDERELRFALCSIKVTA